MALMTKEQYLSSLRRLGHRVFIRGERVDSVPDHPISRPPAMAMAETYQQAEQEDMKPLFTAKSHLTGETINRFTDFMKYMQSNDLVPAACMTDSKGDRSLSPSRQVDKDQYLHIVEEKKGGIVVRGAKMHITGGVNSHEVIVMPTRALQEEDKDYAVAFAVPANTEGITFIYGRQPSDTRRLEANRSDTGNLYYGGCESMVVFDDVFVPEERIFMKGEYPFAGRLVELFAAHHRASYGGCKVGVGDVLIGASAAIAEAHGTDKTSHIKDKIAEMIHLNETLHAGALASAGKGYKTPSGAYAVDHLLANVCKLNITRFPFDISRLAQDIAGGLLVTMPSLDDQDNPEIRDRCGFLFNRIHSWGRLPTGPKNYDYTIGRH
jgi:4-hydroxybutyryl-CoA dehydratase/vinylacetyl-CoA-Delta-isomerase